MNASGRMKRIIQLGDEIGISRCDEDHEDFCEKCGYDRGKSDFYLCQFCDIGIHHECLDSIVTVDKNAFVCEECIIDSLKAFEYWLKSQ